MGGCTKSIIDARDYAAYSHYTYGFLVCSSWKKKQFFDAETMGKIFMKAFTVIKYTYNEVTICLAKCTYTIIIEI